MNSAVALKGGGVGRTGLDELGFAGFERINTKAAHQFLQFVLLFGWVCFGFVRLRLYVGLHELHAFALKRLAAHALTQSSPGLGAVFVPLALKPGKQRPVGLGLLAQQVVVVVGEPV